MKGERSGDRRWAGLEPVGTHQEASRRKIRRRGKQRDILPYLASIGGQKLLSSAEECSLATAVAQGDNAALSQLIESNLRLVVKIAQEYVRQGARLDDLIGEGNLALIRAAKQYDPSHGVRFSTYAAVWIKQSIRHAVADSSAIIRLPGHVMALLRKWRKAERALARDLARKPSFGEIAAVLRLTDAQKSRLASAQLVRQIKLESTVVKEKGGWSPVESLDPYGPPDRAVEMMDNYFLLRSRLNRLDERELFILSLRYGFEDADPMTLQEIAEVLGLTRECVRMTEVSAVRKLKGEDEQPMAGVTEHPRTGTWRRRAGKVVPIQAHSKLSRYRKKIAKGLESPRREANREQPSSPPAAALPLTPDVWSSQCPSRGGAKPTREVDSGASS